LVTGAGSVRSTTRCPAATGGHSKGDEYGGIASDIRRGRLVNRRAATTGPRMTSAGSQDVGGSPRPGGGDRPDRGTATTGALAAGNGDARMQQVASRRWASTMPPHALHDQA
jgi:hypothetical protein